MLNLPIENGRNSKFQILNSYLSPCNQNIHDINFRKMQSEASRELISPKKQIFRSITQQISQFKILSKMQNDISQIQLDLLTDPKTHHIILFRYIHDQNGTLLHSQITQKLPYLEDSLIEKAMESSKFKEYISRIKSAPSTSQVKQLQFISVELFGKNVGFINLRAVTTNNKESLPSYVFIRGRAVGILFLINKKMMLVKQFRVALQDYMYEAPAGMIDQDGDFTGVAAKQIQQETGIKIKAQNLQDLGQMIPSVGACDEHINLYLCEMDVGKQELDVILKKVHGQGQEKIELDLVDFTLENVLKTKDAKLICAALAYQKRKGVHNLK